MKLSISGSALKTHQGSGCFFLQLPPVVGRQWMTEAAGYAVFTPTPAGSSPTLRVAVSTRAKTGFGDARWARPTSISRRTRSHRFRCRLSGTGINTGTNNGIHRIRHRKPEEAFEIRSSKDRAPSISPHILQTAGVTSDLVDNNTTWSCRSRSASKASVMPQFRSSIAPTRKSSSIQMVTAHLTSRSS